jgi:hypothetical protein
MVKQLSWLAIAVLSCAGRLNLVWGQEARATLGGRVVDPQGGVVPQAIVVVTSEATGVAQRTSTNDLGNWVVQFLIPGNYRVSISARGFNTAERGGIELQTSDNKQVDIPLEIGATSTQVEVVGETPLIDTTASTNGTVITRAEIAEMPSMSRVATILAALLGVHSMAHTVINGCR